MNAVVAIVAISAAYATLTWPWVQSLERRMPRALAVAVVNVTLALLFAATAAGIWPLISAQAQELIAAFPGAVTSFVQALPEGARSWAGSASAQLGTTVTTYLKDIFAIAFTIARSLIGIAGALVVIPVLAAYLQLDARRYGDALLTVIPKRYHRRALRASREVSRSVGRTIRGQIVVSAIVGLLVFIALQLLGIRFALIVGLLTAVFDLVPYLGGIVAFIPSLLFALAAGGPSRALFTGIVLLAIFEFEAQLLAPQIVGRNTKLAPSLIVVVLLAGTALFGAAGLFLAVPATAVIAAILRAWYAKEAAAELRGTA